MRISKLLALIIVAPFLFAKCENREKQSILKARAGMSESDSISKAVMQTFGLPYSENIGSDSGLLVFYCSRAYDTSSLIEIKQQKKLIQGVYYEILPEYHRFVTDYADTSSKLIFFEGCSFIVDSATWNSVANQAKAILQERQGLNKNEKYTDGATYGLYYNGQSKHGNSNDEVPFEKFDAFLRSQFLEKHLHLRKPIMHKTK